MENTSKHLKKFDLIISNMVVQWFDDLNKTIQHQKSFLKPDGVILFSTPGPNTFIEWKKSLNALELNNGLLKFPDIKKPIYEELFKSKFETGLSFLRALKNMGASTARKNHSPLSPQDIKKSCTKFEQDFDAQATWHILIGQEKI